MNGDLERDEAKVYIAMTQPMKFAKVPRLYAVLWIGVSLILAILITAVMFALRIKGGIFIIIAISACIWVYGWMKGQKDPEFLNVYWVRFKFLKRTKGPGQYTGNTYYA